MSWTLHKLPALRKRTDADQKTQGIGRPDQTQGRGTRLREDKYPMAGKKLQQVGKSVCTLSRKSFKGTVREMRIQRRGKSKGEGPPQLAVRDFSKKSSQEKKSSRRNPTA